MGELKFFKFIDNEKYVFVGRDGVLMILGEKSTGMEAFSDQWDPHKLGDAVNAWVYPSINNGDPFKHQPYLQFHPDRTVTLSVRGNNAAITADEPGQAAPS